jgi:hypothetical protein
MRKKKLLIFLGYAELFADKALKIANILYRLAQLAEKIYKLIGRL